MIMFNTLSKLFIFGLISIIFLFSACQTTVTIPNDLSPAEIIQRAHEAMDRNRFSVATQYYQALYDRNRDNINLVITAEYHIAHIHYKEGNFSQARRGMNGILEYYKAPDAMYLPQHFKRLAEIILDNIDEKENQPRHLFRR